MKNFVVVSRFFSMLLFMFLTSVAVVSAGVAPSASLEKKEATIIASIERRMVSSFVKKSQKQGNFEVSDENTEMTRAGSSEDTINLKK